jgi:3-dehydroquinate synthase
MDPKRSVQESGKKEGAGGDRVYRFSFNSRSSTVYIRRELPGLEEIKRTADHCLLVCDTHTEALTRTMMGGIPAPVVVLPPGETHKTWSSVEAILAAAREAGLGRDGLFIGVGGGVVGDLAGFAASIYMRGARLCLVSTTLLGMVDAALGGKTGCDLFGIKNLAGTFYPAERIFLPVRALTSLPAHEWKSGMAEIIKAAVLDDGGLFSLLQSLGGGAFFKALPEYDAAGVLELISRSVAIKGRIVEADPTETGTGRFLLNLGHTFAHALEAAAGLGTLSHGEAVAWGMVRACELGRIQGITPPERAAEIERLIASFAYETAAPHPRLRDETAFFKALKTDKKKRDGNLNFVVPARRGAQLLPARTIGEAVLEKLIRGECVFA